MTDLRVPTASPARRWIPVLVALGVATPSLLGLVIVGGILAGPLGLVAPLALIGATYLYRTVVFSATSDEGRSVAREVGGALIGGVLAFGTYAAMMFLGIGLDVIPFISASRSYPYEDDWNALSVVISVGSAVGTWWTLRRWADRGAVSR